MAETEHTIGHAARHDMLLKVECLACGHVGYHKAHEIARVVGPGRPVESIRFVCTGCRARRARAMPMAFDSDRPPKVMVWVPMRLRR